MRRYVGESLVKPDGRPPRVAVIANDALGNYVVSTPLLQMIRREWQPSDLHYLSGNRAAEFWQADAKVSAGVAIFGPPPHDALQQAIAQRGPEPYDLVVNLENSAWAKSVAAVVGEGSPIVGPCLGADGRGDLANAQDDRGRLAADRDWISPALTTTYPFLQSGFIGEIFARLAYLPGDVPLYDVPVEYPSEPVPDVLIAMAASLPEKLWPLEHWRTVLRALREQGRTVGLLGAAPSAQRAFWQGDDAEAAVTQEGLAEDLRGKWTLPQVAGALARAKLVVTLDNGILHLAAAARVSTVGLFREGIHRLWAPPAPTVTVLTHEPGQGVPDIAPARVLEAIGRVV